MSNAKTRYTEEIKQYNERIFMTKEESYGQNYLQKQKELENNAILDNIQEVKENFNSMSQRHAGTVARLVNYIEGAEKELREVNCQVKDEEETVMSLQSHLRVLLEENGQ